MKGNKAKEVSDPKGKKKIKKWKKNNSRAVYGNQADIVKNVSVQWK